MQEHVWAPGRVNLIGEHIDYHGLPVLPMALRQRINVAFERRKDRLIRVIVGQPTLAAAAFSRLSRTTHAAANSNGATT